MPHHALLAIPAMYLTALYPHAAAVALIKRANKNGWDNANAKGAAFSHQLQKNVPADVLARFERAEAAHRNGMENLPLFGLAVLAASWAGVEERSVAATAWAYVVLRCVYNAAYLNTTDRKTAFVRTGIWAVGTGLAGWLFVRAALV